MNKCSLNGSSTKAKSQRLAEANHSTNICSPRANKPEAKSKGKIRHTKTQATTYLIYHAPEPVRRPAHQAQRRALAHATQRDTHKERGTAQHTERDRERHTQRDTAHTQRGRERGTTDSSTMHKDIHNTHTNIVQYNSRQDTHTMV